MLSGLPAFRHLVAKADARGLVTAVTLLLAGGPAAIMLSRKVSGFNTPSKVNEVAFSRAVEEVFEVGRRLISRLETSASPRNREEEAKKARQLAAKRFG